MNLVSVEKPGLSPLHHTISRAFVVHRLKPVADLESAEADYSQCKATVPTARLLNLSYQES